MNTTTDSVRIVLFAADDTSVFLILCEADDPNNWKLPGGKFNSATETPTKAADRELHEELGLTAAGVNLREAGKLVNDDGVSARYIFTARVDIEVIHPNSEIADTQWVTETGVPRCPNKAHILSAVRLVNAHL